MDHPGIRYPANLWFEPEKWRRQSRVTGAALTGIMEGIVLQQK
jgi:hypothetical protein